MNSYTYGPGTIALVTGAAHGIGLGIVRRFIADGLTVVAVDRDEATLRASLGDTPSVHLVVGDVQDPASIADAARRIGRCQILVNDVGVMDGRTFLDLTADAVERTIRTNLLGPWELTRLLASDLVDADTSGSIVFVLSLHTSRIRLCPDYSASKAALAMLMQEAAYDLAKRGIRVNAVSPGVVDTWNDRLPEEERKPPLGGLVIPMGRLGLAEEMAQAVRFLCDPEASSYITGVDIRVDGGLDTYNWLHHMRTVDGHRT